MRLQFKILLVIFLLGTVPVGTVSFLAFHESKSTIEQQTISYLTATNQQKNELIDHWLDTAAEQIEIVAEMPIFSQALAENLPYHSTYSSSDHEILHQKILREHLTPVVKKNMFNELFILSLNNGEVLLSTNHRQQGKFMPRKLFFDKGKKATYIQNVFYSMSIRQPTMVISTPIKNTEGAVIAVLAGRIDLRMLTKIMEAKSNHKDTESSYLINTQNVFITNPRFEENFALRKTGFSHGIEQALSGTTGSAVYLDYRGMQVLGAYLWIKNREMALVTEIEQEEFLAPANKQKGTFVTFTLLVGFVVLLISGLTLSRVFNPLLFLLEAISEVGDGNLSFRPKITGPREIKNLSHAFSDMTTKLQKTLVSRDELKNEIEARKGIEKELTATLDSLKNAHKKLQNESSLRLLAVDRSIQLSEIVENSINQVFVIEAETLHFTYANKVALQNIGYSLSELKELTFFDTDSSMSKQQINKVLQQLKDHTTKNSIIESTITRKDGSFYRVRIHLNMMHFGGSNAFVAIVDDVTEKQKLESQLRQAQKMEAIGTLAGGIAHDFNNILAAILGYSKLAREQVEGPSQLAEDLDHVISSAIRASDLVKQILTYSRKEKTEQKIVNLKTIIEESVTLLRASIPTTITIQLKLQDEKTYIKADVTQLHQIIINLCTNAAQAMEEGGKMTISLKKGPIDKSLLPNRPDLHNQQTTVLSVADTGPGIANNLLHRIFDPYFTTKEIGKGSGMGLAVVSGIVETHGGAIALVSSPGEGSTFSVVLPRISDSPSKKTEKKILPPSGTEHILVIDDEEEIVRITVRNLKKLGYQVTGLKSGQEALQMFKKSPDAFDLVLTDQTMPGITGDQLSQKLLQLRKELPIIVCSGYSSKMDEEKAKAMGLRFLMKPVNINDLATTIRRELDRKL